MSDRHLGEMGKRRDQRRQIVAGEVVPGVEPEAGGFGCVPGRDHLVELARFGGRLERAAIRARVDFDPIGADLGRKRGESAVRRR